MIGVHLEDDAFAPAVSQLPRSVRRVDDPASAIAVVRGSEGWSHAARAAAEAGAAAVVIDDPLALPLDGPGALGIPVIMHRPALAYANPADAGAAAAVIVEVLAPSVCVERAVRDAVGAARMLVGGLEVRSAHRGEHGALALLETTAGLPVSLVAGSGGRGRGFERMRVHVLGPRRLEIVWSGESIGASISLHDEDGQRVLPPLYESARRRTLRRAVQIVREAGACADLEELLADGAIARRVVGPTDKRE